jgi:hypothetical protein
MLMQIPIKNLNKQIVAYTLVSPEDFDTLNLYKWSKDKDNYAREH